MNTKTQKLVTAGYALANGLDAESAKLVKQLADELAVQRVRADELNKQVVNLAVQAEEQRAVMSRAANDIAYAIFNLSDKTLNDLKPGIIESTCPTDTALIAERELRKGAAV